MFILATAEGGAGLFGSSSSGGWGGMAIYIVFLIALFYFLLIRPQRKQRKQKSEMMNALSVGDEIFTIGGILGTVTRIKERTIWLRISEKTEIELQKSAIGGISTKTEE